jgi:hypothetical protein
MVSPQLLEELSKLPRADKLRVMQVLIAQISQEEELIVPGATYEISSFYNCGKAATQLQEFLEQQNKND